MAVRDLKSFFRAHVDLIHWGQQGLESLAVIPHVEDREVEGDTAAHFTLDVVVFVVTDLRLLLGSDHCAFERPLAWRPLLIQFACTEGDAVLVYYDPFGAEGGQWRPVSINPPLEGTKWLGAWFC